MAEHLTTTPSGVEILFEDGAPDPETGKSKYRSYLVNGDKLPSVTTALGVIAKDGLQYGSEKLAVAGCIELAKEGELPITVEGTLSRLKARELRFWQVWNAKRDRGTATHDDLLALATGTPLRDLSDWPIEQQGFARGVAAWFADERPEVVAAEVSVASLEHGYAGRLDLVCRMGGRVHLVDLKTGDIKRNRDGTAKPPYPEHLAQLGAYAAAYEESGYGTTDVQGVLRVDEAGQVDYHVTVADTKVFLASLALYRAMRGLTYQRPLELAA